MFRRSFLKYFGIPCLMVCAAAALAQQPNSTGQLPIPYGLSISLENAKKAVAPAIAVAKKNNWTMAVAIVDVSGNLVYFEKMDNTQSASSNIAIDKAQSALAFKRPTKALQDQVAAGGEGLRFLALRGVVPVDGGIPIIVDGKIIGAIGASGGTSPQDGQCAQAGADALK